MAETFCGINRQDIFVEPLYFRSDSTQYSNHGIHIAQAWNITDYTPTVCQEAGGHQFEHGVFRATDLDLPLQPFAPSDPQSITTPPEHAGQTQKSKKAPEPQRNRANDTCGCSPCDTKTAIGRLDAIYYMRFCQGDFQSMST